MGRYLVTGGCGFIGSNLVKNLLFDGHEVVVVDDLSTGVRENIPSNVEIFEANVNDVRILTKVFNKHIDGCFHLAANPSVSASLNDYLGCHKTNLGGTIAVLEVAARLKAKINKIVPIVFASSCAVYGNPGKKILSESEKFKPLSAYGVDKLCGELHAEYSARILGVPSIGLRFFNIFGPGQSPQSDYSGVLSIFCKNMSQGDQVTIFGDGCQTRDFVFVDDAVEALRKAMEITLEHSPGVFNICKGTGISIFDIGKRIAELCDLDFHPQYDLEREGDIKFSVGDPTLAQNLLTWHPSTELNDGLLQTIEWMRGV